MNLCLVQAATYIQRFCLEIYHKPGKQNTIPNALSRLSHQEAEAEANKKSILDTLFIESIYIFHVLITEVSDEFKISLREDYKHDAQWKKVITDLQVNVKKKISANLSYKLNNDLLYSIKYNSRKCLCISDMLIENIFKMIHDEMRHCRFDKVFECLHELTINKTSHQLWVYIDECSDCDKNQTCCHKFYSDLQSILSLLISFHILVIDFILALLISEKTITSCSSS